MKKLVKWFAQGLVILAPILITLLVAFKVFQLIDGLVPAKFPGLGFVATIGLITFVGFLASTILGSVFAYIEGLFSRLPLLKILYNAVKDLLEAFAGDRRSFDAPVTVKLSAGSRVKMVGFVTQKDLSFLGLKGEVSVYCPHSYNFSGQLIVVPRSLVKPLKKDSSAVMSFIVSGGVAGEAKKQ